MALFILQRVVHAVAVIFAATTVVFAIIHFSGDPLSGLVPPGASPEQQQSIRHEFGLDRSIPVQYGIFLQHAVHGDFGESWRSRQSALTTVLDRLPATLELAAAALAIATLIGVPLGILGASRRRPLLGTAAEGFSLLGQAIPNFWLGSMLIVVFAVHFRWLPSSGGGGLRALILPAISLAAYPASVISQLVRVSLSETLERDYIRTAEGKGLSNFTILRAHALKNAFLPTLAYFGLQAGFLIGGAVVVEGVFAYPGIGQLALQSVTSRDLPTVEAFVAVVATMIVAANLCVDIVARWVDPRLRSEPA